MRICQRCVALSQSKAVRLAVRGAGLPGIVNTRRSCTCTVRSRLTTLVARRKSDGESASDINIMTWIILLLYENAFGYIDCCDQRENWTSDVVVRECNWDGGRCMYLSSRVGTIGFDSALTAIFITGQLRTFVADEVLAEITARLVKAVEGAGGAGVGLFPHDELVPS